MSKLLFAVSHEWVRVEGSKAKIGLSDYGQKLMGDLVFIELPKVGQKVECAKELCSVESIKAVSEIYSPVCGTVVAVNEDLEARPELINQSAYDAWICEIEFEKVSDELISEEDYKKRT